MWVAIGVSSLGFALYVMLRVKSGLVKIDEIRLELKSDGLGMGRLGFLDGVEEGVRWLWVRRWKRDAMREKGVCLIE